MIIKVALLSNGPIGNDESEPEAYLNSDHISSVVKQNGRCFIYMVGDDARLVVSEEEASYVVQMLTDLHVARGNVA